MRLRLLILKLNLDLGFEGGGGGGDCVVAVVAETAGAVGVVAIAADDNGGMDLSAAMSVDDDDDGGSGGGGDLIAFNVLTTDALLSKFDSDANICAWVGITGNSVDDCLLLPSVDDAEPTVKSCVF